MKSVILAAVAAMFVCAPAFAADAMPVPMTTEQQQQCNTDMANCKDQVCKDALAAKGCKAQVAPAAAN